MPKASPVGGDSIGSRLLHLCGVQDRTVIDVVRACPNVSESSFRDYLADYSVPGGIAIIDVCYALGCTADWLLGIAPPGQR